MPTTKGPKASSANPKTNKKSMKKDEQADRDEDYEGHCCGDCGAAVLDTQQGLRCDGCGFWHHLTCERVREEIYNFLCKFDDEPTLQWHCRKCTAVSKKMMPTLALMKENQHDLEEKVNDLASTMMKKLDELTQKINAKENSSQTSTDKGLEVKVDTLIENMEKIRMETVENKVDKLVATVEKQSKLDNHNVLDRVEDAVRLKLQEDKEENEELMRRKTSIIIHGVKESSSEQSETRRKHDEDEITAILHELESDEVSVQSAIRLGRWEKEKTDKPRPLKVTFVSENQKEKVLRKSKNLKGKKEKGWDGVFMHQDLTPKQRKERQKLVQEMKERKTRGEKDLIIVNGKIVVRWKKDQEEEQQPVRSD